MFICKQIALALFGLFVISFCLDLQILKNPENYGPYVMVWDSYGLCKGPKAVNLTKETVYLKKEEGVCVFNMTFLGETRIDEVKVTVFSENNGIKNTLWNYRIKDPCRHYMVSRIIKEQLKTDNCVVKKGFYSCRLNFHQSSADFLGRSFFYGKFTFKAVVLSKTGNIHCFENRVSFSKRS